MSIRGPAKLTELREGEWVPCRFERVARVEEMRNGASRAVAWVSEEQIDVLLKLSELLPEPVALLWVLHVPRATGEAGRHQSPLLTFDEASRLLLDHRALFEHDGRSDIWMHSSSAAATIVLDRHDRLFAYGPLDRFIDALKSLGFVEGHAVIPDPHAHNYHAGYDDLEISFAAAFDWTITDLRPEDC